jgi:hypothetical protein
MKNLFKYQTLLILITLSFSSSIYAKRFFADDEDIVWSSGLNQYMKYEKQDSTKLGANEHPVELDQKQIANALNALEYTVKKMLTGETIKSVFTISQMNLLAKQFAKGFKNAKPGQDIIFVIEGINPKLLILTDKYFLTGRAFYKEGKLNIIIGDYNMVRNEAFEIYYDPSGRAALPYTFNFGSRSKRSNKFKGILLPAPGVENKVVQNKFRSDWFMLDVPLASQAILAKMEELKNPTTINDRQIQVEAAKLAKERRQMRAEMARMRKEMKNINSDGGSSSKTPEERIVTLDQLLSKDLITQEEYDIRREEILNDI